MRIISATRRGSLSILRKTISYRYCPRHPSRQQQQQQQQPQLSTDTVTWHHTPLSSFAMATLARHLILCSSSPSQRRRRTLQPDAAAGTEAPAAPQSSTTRRLVVAASTALAATAALSARRPAPPPPAMAAEAAVVPAPPPPTTAPGTVPRWGTRSYFRERYFEPELTAEEAAARIRQTAEGMRTLRPMLETMSWKYVLFYVRLKSKYLSLDLTTAMAGVPQGRRSDYVRVANELVDNMTEFDRFVRTPKVYESYLFYEKTLKSLDDVAEFLV